MAIKYTWKITALKKAPTMDGLSDVITGINFDYTGTKGSGASKKEATFHGACPVSAPEADTFKAIDQITEADVIVWAKANHPVEHMQEVITKNIAEQEAPTDQEVNDTDVSWLPASSIAPEAGE